MYALEVFLSRRRTVLDYPGRTRRTECEKTKNRSARPLRAAEEMGVCAVQETADGRMRSVRFLMYVEEKKDPNNMSLINSCDR